MSTRFGSSPQWPSIEPSRLRHEITIQAPNTASLDAAGQPSSTWQDVGTVYAAIEAATLDERYGSDEVTSRVTDNITIRYPQFVIQPGMRVSFGARAFRVQAVEDIRQLHVLVVMKCLEINAETGAEL